MLLRVLDGSTWSVIICIMTFIATIFGIVIKKQNSNKIMVGNKIMISLDPKYTSLMDSLIYLRKSFWMIMLCGEFLVLLWDFGTKLHGIYEYLVSPFILAVIVLYPVLAVSLNIAIPYVNVQKTKELCGEHYEKFKDSKSLIACTTMNIVYTVLVFTYSFVLGAALHGNLQESDEKTCVGVGVIISLCCALILLEVTFTESIPFYRNKFNMYLVTEKQYEKFEIRMHKGIKHKYNKYKIKKEDVIKINKNKDLLIVNEENGSKTYIQYNNIDYIIDPDGNKITY